MKNLVFGAALSLSTVLTALPAFAQPSEADAPRGVRAGGDDAPREGGQCLCDRRGRHGRHGNPERRLERLTALLELTPEQVTELRSIFEAAREEHRGLERGPEGREAHRAVRERTHERMAAVLTAEQRERFEAHRAERRPRRGERGERGHGQCGAR